jgi:chromosome segregation protein
LAQIGVADEDTGQALAIGQRLVTRDGRMRRWDGFISVGGGAAAAERLLRANRLAEIDRQLPGREQAVSDAQSVRDAAATAVETHRTEAEAAQGCSRGRTRRPGRGRAGDHAAV